MNSSQENFNFELAEPTQYTFLTDNQSFNEHCSLWLEKEFLAIDTEFIRVSTFYPKIGLIQVCDGINNYLIDPLIIDDWSQFKNIMLKSSILKIFHSCSEDLLVFFAFLKVIPTPIFDTQIATAFLNEGFALSYQNLVKIRKNIEIPKGETRSDWRQRPLTEHQLKYAALDVAYLPEICRWQTNKLEEIDKLTWHQDECQRIISLYESEVQVDFSLYYLGMKSAWQLNAVQLGALKFLAAWREERARLRDKPRSWIIKDKELIAIAKALPENKPQLSSMANIHKSFVQHEGDDILELIQNVKSLDESELPELMPRPLTTGQKNKLKKAQAFAEEKASSLLVPVELLARKRCIMALYLNILQAQAQGLEINEENIIIPEELRGWRKEILLHSLLEILK